MCATRCRDPFGHYEDDTLDLPCGHQVIVYRCGCTCHDHAHEERDGQPLAELEEAR